NTKQSHPRSHHPGKPLAPWSVLPPLDRAVPWAAAWVRTEPGGSAREAVRWYPPYVATGDHAGSTGGGGGLSEAKGPAPYTGFPPTIVKSASRLLICSSGIAK